MRRFTLKSEYIGCHQLITKNLGSARDRMWINKREADRDECFGSESVLRLFVFSKIRYAGDACENRDVSAQFNLPVPVKNLVNGSWALQSRFKVTRSS